MKPDWKGPGLACMEGYFADIRQVLVTPGVIAPPRPPLAHRPGLSDSFPSTDSLFVTLGLPTCSSQLRLGDFPSYSSPHPLLPPLLSDLLPISRDVSLPTTYPPPFTSLNSNRCHSPLISSPSLPLSASLYQPWLQHQLAACSPVNCSKCSRTRTSPGLAAAWSTATFSNGRSCL